MSGYHLRSQVNRTVVIEHHRQFFQWTIRDDPPTRVVGCAIPPARIVGPDETVEAPIFSLSGRHMLEFDGTRGDVNSSGDMIMEYHGRLLEAAWTQDDLIINVHGRYYRTRVGMGVEQPRRSGEELEAQSEEGQCRFCRAEGPRGCYCADCFDSGIVRLHE